ncbi:hypothetical protein P8C59_007358 [Phyllachora maydis]|uniref:Uncharacterized protein n=1 Tax=Phyllachora maydis TaxID=1825666 RepID=A0AAD9MDG9_9PEZI|nr:hypothetical protein P8C59_007358 [Phyllachora maydis]
MICTSSSSSNNNNSSSSSSNNSSSISSTSSNNPKSVCLFLDRFLELRSNLAIKAKYNGAKCVLVLVDKARALVKRRAPAAGITPI